MASVRVPMPVRMNMSMGLIVPVGVLVSIAVRMHLSYSMRRSAPAHSGCLLITQFDTCPPRMH
jgi:hypothetical protein